MLKLVVCIGLIACYVEQAIGGISGGTAAPSTAFSHQVSLEIRDFYTCSGSLLSENTVITDAKCIEGVNPKDIKIRAGTNKRYSGGSVFEVSSVIVHPSYKSTTKDNNIALLKLKGRVTLGKNIKLIKIVDKKPASGTQTAVSGWELENSFSSFNNDLLQVLNLKIQKCPDNDELKICAAANSKNEICQCDLGAPLITSAGLAGIVSTSCECGEIGIYTNLVKFREWILSNVNIPSV